jgi:YD repeat-containing protein
VNLREGSFVTATSDGSVGHFLLRRSYNSRSQDIGAFGFGWQSELDHALHDPPGLKIRRDPQGHLIHEIRQSSTGKVWRYRYDQWNLISVELSQRKKKLWQISYRYDAFHNLTQATTSQGQEKITYLSHDDQVQSYQDTKKCQEVYSYEQQSWGAVYVSRTLVDRRCPGLPVTHFAYEFWSKRQSNGTNLLLKARLTSEHKKMNFEFDRISGKTLSANFME